MHVVAREEGIRGLYRGLGIVTVVGTPAFVLYLGAYEVSFDSYRK